MPNFRKSTKSPNKRKNKQHKNNKNNKHDKDKYRRPPTGDGITWGSSEPPKPEVTYTQRNFYYIVGGIVLLLLFCLWAFVDDRATIERAKKQEQERKARANRTQTEDRPRKEFTFEYAHLYNTSQFSETMKNYQENDEDDRIIVVAFDDSTRDAEGSATKVRSFRKYESIAKSIPRKKVFKRYEVDELPLIIAFDCGNPEDKAAEQFCKQIVGENVPNVVIFRPQQQPRALPNDYRSDNQIINYLYNLMQPAVRYLEESQDCEAFVANDEMMNVVLFGDEKTGSFDQVADVLREFARFGKTRNPEAVEEFDTELNSILVWKTFGQNPDRFVGNISDSQAVYTYVMNNYLPVFGEFNPTTSNRYMKRGLPIVWIAYDRYSDDSKDILEVAETMAHRYVGAMSFVQLDVKSYPQIATNFGIDLDSSGSKDDDEDDDDDDDDENKKGSTDDDEDEDTNRLPQVFIMNQMAQLREFIDSENVEESIDKVCDEYMNMVRASRGEGLTELDGSDYGGDDDEFEEDDDEDEGMGNVEMGGDYDEDEDDDDDEDEDDEDDDDDDEDEDVSPPGSEGASAPKQDL